MSQTVPAPIRRRTHQDHPAPTPAILETGLPALTSSVERGAFVISTASLVSLLAILAIAGAAVVTR